MKSELTKEQRDAEIFKRYDELRSIGYGHNQAAGAIASLEYIKLSVAGVNGVLYKSGRKQTGNHIIVNDAHYGAIYWQTAYRELIRQLMANNRQLPQCMASVEQMGILLHFKKKLDEVKSLDKQAK